MNKSLIKILGSLVVASALHQAAFALPFINGEIDVAASGAYAKVDFKKNTVTFTPASPALNAAVTYADGEWSSLIGDKATYFNFKYDAPGASSIPLPPLTVWSIPGKASFDLVAITSIIEDSTLPGLSLSLQGTGIAHLKGHQDTEGLWSFSASSTKTKFSFSSTDSVTHSVPDSGLTAMMVGVGLLAAGIARRRANQVVQS